MKKILSSAILIVATLFIWTQTAWAKDIWLTIPDPIAMPKAMESGNAEINGMKMYYAKYGDASKSSILMIHGGAAYGDIWSSQVADLAKDYQVIIADTRGHGRSTNDGSAYSVALLAKDYVALLDHLKIEQVHLVGWSDGANIGYEIAKTAPKRLKSLFAHAGNVTLKGVNPSVENNAVFGEYVGKMAEIYGKISPTPDQFEAFIGGVSKMWYTDKANGLEEVKQITVPTLVVQSEYDEAILPKHSKAIAENIPNAEMLVLNKVSHFAMLQAPSAYSAAIRAFVAKH